LTKIVIPRFEKLNPGIKVEQVPFSYSSLQQKLTTSVAGGTLPDVIRADLAWVPQYAKLGAFAKLDREMPDFKKLASAVYPGSLATNYYKGHYYGLPLDTNTRVLMYNNDALASAGITSPPTTFAALRAAAPKLKAKGIYLFADGGTGGWNVLPWIWSGGGSLTNKTFTRATGYLNSAKSVAAVQLLADLYKEGAIPSLIALGYPVMVGLSRKRFIGEITGVKEPAARLSGTLGANVAALARGARIFRVHDVRPAREALDVAWQILKT